ncbi:hypothetical protein V1478_002471 [Vespula squamosa]|uniref:Uncharacterized protein n=1 Tax=Vespula squamosa TaxID=30214 RepID=A0ABD2BSM8_VESSQ
MTTKTKTTKTTKTKKKTKTETINDDTSDDFYTLLNMAYRKLFRRRSGYFVNERKYSLESTCLTGYCESYTLCIKGILVISNRAATAAVVAAAAAAAAAATALQISAALSINR